MPTIRKLVPAMSRAELARILKRFRHVRRARYGWGGYRLAWHRPGAVWAMDFVLPSGPVDDRFPCVLSICDLASRFQLLWKPMDAETAEVVAEALRMLFLLCGPPLVLKSDNGPSFLAEATAAVLAEWRVTALFSPPRRPWYNGICERANGILSVATSAEAEEEGHAESWTSADLEQARQWNNEVRRPWVLKGRTPVELWDPRVSPSRDERETFLAAVELGRLAERAQRAHGPDQALNHAARAAIDRVAVRDALCDLGYLTIKAGKSGRDLSAAARPCLGVGPAACVPAAPPAALERIPDAGNVSLGVEPSLAGGARATPLLAEGTASAPCDASPIGLGCDETPPAAPPLAFAQSPCSAGDGDGTRPGGQEIPAAKLALPAPSGKLSEEARTHGTCAGPSGPVHVGPGLVHRLRRFITPLIDRLKAAKIR
jgi:hypothetical protein